MSHCFERGQSEALVERGKYKNFGDIIKNSEHFNRHKSEKAHVVLHATSHHGSSQARVTGKVVADDDELQIGELLLFLQFILQRRERLDDAHDILVRPYRS